MALGRFTAEFEMGSGMDTPPKPPGRRRTEGTEAHLRRHSSLSKNPSSMNIDNESNQAVRTISTSKLRTLLPFHTWPINEVVFLGSQGKSCFEVGFPLRCLQRLSIPHLATRLCRWRDNRCTRGASFPVLSYYLRRGLQASLLHDRWTELSHDVLNPAHVPL